MINFKEIGRDTWDRYWESASKAPLTQSWEYGDAKCQAEKFRAKRYLIEHDGSPQALLQVLHRSVSGLAGAARVNRGPAWLHEDSGSVSREVCGQILQGMRRLALRNRWLYMLVAPNLPPADTTDALFQEFGFRKKDVHGYGSSLVDITRDLETIRGSFDGKFRRNLKKALDGGLEVEEPPLEEGLRVLAEKYERMKQDRTFSGIPNELLLAMAAQKGPRWNFRVFFARKEGRRVSGTICVGHGDAYSYLVGWSSDEGRALRATFFLYWKAMQVFQKLAYRWFDVGGLDAATPEGIAVFKRGVNGTPYTLAGEYASYALVPKRLLRLFPAAAGK